MKNKRLKNAMEYAKGHGIAVSRRHISHGITEVSLLGPGGLFSETGLYTTGNASGQATFIIKQSRRILNACESVISGRMYRTSFGAIYFLAPGAGSFYWDHTRKVWKEFPGDMSRMVHLLNREDTVKHWVSVARRKIYAPVMITG